MARTWRYATAARRQQRWVPAQGMELVAETDLRTVQEAFVGSPCIVEVRDEDAASGAYLVRINWWAWQNLRRSGSYQEERHDITITIERG